MFYMQRGKRRAICKICSDIEHKKYVLQNPEIIKKHEAKRHLKNRENRLKGMRKYHATHKKQIAKRKSEYGKRNLKTLNGKSSLKRERIRQAVPKGLSKADRSRIIKIYESCPKGYHVDHIIPLKGEKVCGLHVPWNLQYLPAKQNLKKYNKY